MSGVEVQNTIRFDFENGSRRPTLNEVAKFIKSLDVSIDGIEASYRIADEKAMFIKFKSEEAMLHALRSNGDEQSFRYDDGNAVKVQISQAAGKILYVRVYDLPPEVQDDTVASVLGKYGKVKRVVREKFPAELGLNIHSGVRGVYMDVRMEIPSFMFFRNRKGNIFYEGNKNLCFVCNSEEHRMNSCPKRKARREQRKENPVQQEDQGQPKASEQTDSYAVVAAGNVSKNGNKQVQEAEEEVIEEVVLEMDVSSPEVEENGEKEGEISKSQPPPVFKYPNDRYYYYKFGIVDYTEKERIKDEEEAKRLALWKEKQREEELERRRQKEEAKLRSPPKKNKKNF